MLSNSVKALQNQTRCKFCGSPNLNQKETESTLQLVCLACDRINQTAFRPIDLAGSSSLATLFRTEVVSCSCCHELQRLLGTLTKIESALTIITRALINGGAR